jgi:putative ABC transport system ATP-binding protein
MSTTAAHDVPPAAPALLEAVGLHRAFGATPALRGADLTVSRGEVVAIMGPSGSGKSTLLHCLAGILRPDAGEVRYGGRRIDALSEHDRTVLRRLEFGFLFQFGQLVPELPAVENVALPLLLAGRRRAEALDRASAWFDRLDIEGLGHRRPGELSGGQAQRVALARALVTSPAVLFADEPTGSLDSLAGERVMDLLVDTARAEGTTVVVVTHEARIAAYAEREVIVRDGRCTAPVGIR